MLVLRRDWMQGDDPGMNCWYVVGAEQTAIVAADLSSYSIAIYDLTARPSALIATLSSTTPALQVFNSAQLDGYWTKDDIGYNVRHYMRDSYATFVPGHAYRFVYTLTTGAFDEGAGNWGAITLVREGACKARGGLV